MSKPNQPKYPEFKDYLYEIENYGDRLERFYEEFQHVDYKTTQRIIEWIEAAWNCAREEIYDEPRPSDQAD